MDNAMDNWSHVTEMHIDQELIEEIAHECHRPINEVQDIYLAEKERLERTARITDYLAVLVSRRVRNQLQERPSLRGRSGASTG